MKHLVGYLQQQSIISHSVTTPYLHWRLLHFNEAAVRAHNLLNVPWNIRISSFSSMFLSTYSKNLFVFIIYNRKIYLHVLCIPFWPCLLTQLPKTLTLLFHTPPNKFLRIHFSQHHYISLTKRNTNYNSIVL